MAGDWIPMRHGLERERETLIVAARLSIRPDFATGLMRRFWCWASDTTTDGFLSGMTFEIIDQQVVDYAGFCEAMSAAGWLVQRSNGVRIPNFDHWLSDSAKARLGEAKRKRLQRMKLPEGPDPHKSPGKRPELVRTNLGQTGQDRRDKPPGAGAPAPGEGSRPVAPRLSWSAETGWTGPDEALRGVWALAYPACNIDRQLAAMDAWLRANPKRAVKSNWDRFATNWLAKEQDRGGDLRAAVGGGPGQRRAQPGNTDRLAARRDRQRSTEYAEPITLPIFDGAADGQG